MGNVGRKLRAPLARAESAMLLMRDTTESRTGDEPRHTKQSEIESLDFYNRDSMVYRQYISTKVKLWNMEKTATKWLLYLIEGIIIGLIAYGIRRCVGMLQDFKLEWLNHHLNHGYFFLAFTSYFGTSLGFVIVAFCVCALCGPLSAGSGIPEVKGYLNGVKIAGTVNIKTFVGKVVSLIFAFSSGLALGPEGPMVHIGSIIGAGLGLGKSRTLNIRLPSVFNRFRNDSDQRDFIASGAAAGIAAAFGAPVGGVLYAFEEASSFWSQQLTWRAFFGCMISAFTVAFMFKIESGSLQHGYGLLTFDMSRKYLYRYEELLAFAFVGVLGGLLGALFVTLNIRLNKWRRDRLAGNLKLRFFELMLIALFTFSVAFIVPLFYSCRSLDKIHYSNETCEIQHIEKPVRGYCDENHYNPMSNLLQQPIEHTLRFMYARASGIFPFEVLIVYFIVYFAMVTVTAGAYTAGGLFVPMMVLGACMGQMIGMFLKVVFPSLDPSIYALVGSAAMLTGYCRITISLCVIILEITEATQYLLPIMMCIMCAKWTGDAFTSSHTEMLMHLKHIMYLEPRPPHSTLLQTVSDIMQTQVVCLDEVSRVSTILQTLRLTNHNGFPIVTKLPGSDRKVFRGSVLRHDLLALLERRIMFSPALETEQPTVDADEWQVILGNKPPLLDSLNLSSEEQEHFVDLKPYMNQSAIVIHARCSYSEAYRMFMKMELRHLIVVNDFNEVVGIITRKDLLFYHHLD